MTPQGHEKHERKFVNKRTSGLIADEKLLFVYTDLSTEEGQW